MSRKTNYTTIPRDGLVGEWLLDGNANDTSGGGNNGTETDITYVGANKGYVNQCGSFNGTSSYISGIGNQIPSGVQSYYAFWVKPTDLSGGDTFSSTNPRNIIGEGAYNVGFIRFLGDRINVGVCNSTFYETRTENILTLNEYQFIEILITPGDKTKIWRNGILLNNTGQDDTFPTTWTDGNNVIGANKHYNNRYFKGELSLIRKYTSITNTNLAFYQEGLRKFGPTRGLKNNNIFVGSLPNLEQGKVLEISKPQVGGTYYDQSGNGNNGTATDITDSTVGQANVMSLSSGSISWNSISYVDSVCFEKISGKWQLQYNPSYITDTGISNQTIDIYNILLYNRALSDKEVQQIYYSQKGNFIN